MKIVLTLVDEAGARPSKCRNCAICISGKAMDVVVSFVGSGTAWPWRRCEELKKPLVLFDCSTLRIFEMPATSMFSLRPHATMDNISPDPSVKPGGSRPKASSLINQDYA
jgi:hypothetical protein